MARHRQPKKTDPYLLLQSLPKEVSRRKLRLFGCGCCRERAWHLLTDPRLREAVEVAERYADGDANYASLRAAQAAAQAAYEALRLAPPRIDRGFSSTVALNAAAAAVLTAHRQACPRAVA